ncbi:UvrD-helicase domain-containing protein [Streptomyces sp. NPDC020875]|uniref:UvrD-helicase domain-containing protein n=1 Tax=Streptomyces sp. NPDC020875 TaxID=3154898 RepID=UPI0033D97505
MSRAYSDNPALTPEQQAVVDQPWDARVLVTAGAGAGKTHALVRRLEALTSHAEDALEAGEILVLSFSRAAVRELRSRIAEHSDRARRVRVRTFDSWALGLLTSISPDAARGGPGFDERVRRAAEAVEDGAVEESEAGIPAHVVIDEVQDLIGVRRELVETLLDRFQDVCGFTVVGDAAQAVYGFQVSDPDARAAETNYFFDWLRASYGEDLVELRLPTNFRAVTEEARTALSLGPALERLSSDPVRGAEEGESLYRELRARLLARPDFGDLDDPFTLDSLRGYPGTCAVLCRDNRQALSLSQSLFEKGVAHRLQRAVRDRPVPPWVAPLLRRGDSGQLDEIAFREAAAGIGAPAAGDLGRIWQSLRGVAGGRRGTLDLGALRRTIVEGRLPDDVTVDDSASLVVSTVHRAKGLEFDRVIVVEPASIPELRERHTHLDPAAEARALYVAMTRPREDLFRIPAPTTFHLRRDRSIDRWYVGGRRPGRHFGIEATGSDVSREHPPGTEGFEADPVAVQEYLASSVRPGDGLTLRLQHRLPMAADQSPPYTVLHDGVPVGVVSEEFRRALHSSLGGGRGREVAWPEEIDGFRVDTTETVAGSTASGNRAGLGRHGVWLVPRPTGIGRYGWRRESDEMWAS